MASLRRIVDALILAVFLNFPRIPLHDDLAVRIRDAYVVFLERVPQGQQHLAANIGEALLRVVDPEAKHEVEGAVAEAGQPADRAAGRFDPADTRGGFDGQP